MRRGGPVPREDDQFPLPIGAAHAQDTPARRPRLRRPAPGRAGRARLVVGRRRQPGLRRRRQLGRELHERLRRAVQRRLVRRSRLDGWTVQYASAAGTSWQATALAGSIAPGHHYLVQLTLGRRRSVPRCPPPTRPARPTWPSPAARSRSSPARRRSAAARRPAAAPASPGSRTSSATARPPTTKARRPRRAEQLDRRDSRRRRLHGHRLERRRLHCGCAHAAQHLVAGGDAAAAVAGRRGGDDVARRERRRRHPARPVARARAARRSASARPLPATRRRRSPSGSRSTATTRPATR